MLSNEIRERYLKFFEKRGHKIIPSASLVPENYVIPDKGSLFTTAGMQPLIPYLLGEKHPAGKRIVDVQKCVRTGDIEEVGDNRHLTFFEMLGNWSLGDYFKKESIAWSLEFLTSKEEGLGLDPKRLYITVFRGEDLPAQAGGIPKDEESIAIWQENFSKFNISADIAGDDEVIKNNIRIIPLGKEDNFWIAGQTGPCGPDTEMFYDVSGKGKVEGKFQDLVKSGRIIEIWNNVFMEFNKTADGKYEKLSKLNVDTGMGLERTSVVMQGKNNVYETDIFEGLMKISAKLADDLKSQRIISDHMRSAIFMIGDGVLPSNTEAGYVLRRLIRRAIFRAVSLTTPADYVTEFVNQISNQYKDVYPEIKNNFNNIVSVIKEESKKFEKTQADGARMFMKITTSNISGQEAFKLFTTYGYPFELILEMAKQNEKAVDVEGFNAEFKKHQKISKAGSEQKFKGGLAGTGEIETKYHTATHLLLGALRRVLKAEITQKGSNITAERMRFDFNWPEKVPAEKLKEVEDLVNQKISEKIPVEMMELGKEEAKKIVKTLSFDLSKYGDIVKVYKIDDFSIEFCGGPHVKNTGQLGHFKIVKEEASSAGVRRIKAVFGIN